MAILGLSVLLAGCLPIQLHTADRIQTECALVGDREGVLVADARTGLGIRDATGRTWPVVWPHGFTARREMDGVRLVDGAGAAVAREGQLVRLRGAVQGPDGLLHPCQATGLESHS